ncbi:hypothetical protein HNR56_003196, partial [Roseospira marina]|nr:hypothetical protein [Roseospira marina]MBB5088488.1 hypothetical protein [Roseospira marina]
MLGNAIPRAIPALPRPATGDRIDLVTAGVVQPAATFSRASSAILWDGAAFQAVGPDVPR